MDAGEGRKYEYEEITDTGVVLRERRMGYSTHGYDFDDATGAIIGYEQIIRYLRLMRPLYQRLDALDEWQAIVDDLRRRYPGRKLLLEMLEAL